MKTGIFIGGIGKSTTKDTLENYSNRLLSELEYSTKGKKYYSKKELINYGPADSLNVKIFQTTIDSQPKDSDDVVFNFYEFQYSLILTESFDKQNLLYKNLQLLLLVLRKTPILLLNLFKLRSLLKGKQTFYLFVIFFLMSFSILIFLPSFLPIINDLFKTIGWKTLEITPFIDTASKITLTITSILILFIPESTSIITNLASEFTALDNYLQFGEQSQIIQGNLDELYEFIVENNPETSIEIHSYSFGTIIAMDALFPMTNEISDNIKSYTKTFISIGAPYEFILAYYPNYYSNRNLKMGDYLHWLNVYSNMDAFASNFRNNNTAGEAEFSIFNTNFKPLNINYEIARKEAFNPLSFLALNNLKMHRSYWDENNKSQSCVRLIYKKIIELEGSF